ncbi:PREDICTED: uncharacterized protein LOC109591059 [Amphimedon queenslandica]|uniref:Uncharacterized protein n=2 Tax=Amphimedon queenslandica TaxID=400682 RepID=A0AAN0JZS5_AMPQE|nr:PREDICTED: uncharacterized protein LOC109591059 [Amphimedon queenslandica]|eukprot:XP_019862425.1 PREDICTED: uncharacterized protein LOC109591059 [Amphimedon queenslandica]
MSSVQYSIKNPQGRNVKKTFNKDDHGRIMTSLNSIAIKYMILGQEFCIPEHKVEAIEANNRGKQWQCLNGVVGEWLKWNFTDDVKEKKVQPNLDWLVQAVSVIDGKLANKLKRDYGFEESCDIPDIGTEQQGQIPQPLVETNRPREEEDEENDYQEDIN